MNSAATLLVTLLVVTGGSAPIVDETAPPDAPLSVDADQHGSEVLFFTAKDCGFKQSDYRVQTHSVHTEAVLTAALRKLLRTWRLPRDPSARRLLQRVVIIDGVARVDFMHFGNTSLTWARTSCGGTKFLGSLNRTVFQFDSVRAARYSFDGSCEAFQAFLQSTCRGGHEFFTNKLPQPVRL